MQHQRRVENGGSYIFRTDIRDRYRKCTAVDLDSMTVHFTEKLVINYQLKHLWMECPKCQKFLQFKKDPNHPHRMLFKYALIL